MKKNLTQTDINEKNNNAGETKEKKPRQKKSEYEGSRWSSLILLSITIIVSFFLYLSGNH